MTLFLFMSMGFPEETFAAKAHAMKILLILAHPDDETYIRASLVRLIEQGNEVHAIYLTAGEGGSDRHWNDARSAAQLSLKEQADRRSSLRKTRTLELANAAEKYGFTDHVILGVPDVPRRDPLTQLPERNSGPFLKSGGPWDVAAIQKQISAISEKIKPDLVITFFPDQPTTHAHHQAVAKIVEQMRNENRFGKQIKAAFGFYEADVVTRHEALNFPLSSVRVEVSPRWISDQPGPHLGKAYGEIGTQCELFHDSQLKGDTDILIRQWDKNPHEVFAPLALNDSIIPLTAALNGGTNKSTNVQVFPK